MRCVSPHPPVRDHVKHRAKLAGLAESPRRLAIHRVEQTADRVQHSAELWVYRHEEEGDGGEDDARVADQVGHEEKHVLVDSAAGGSAHNFVAGSSRPGVGWRRSQMGNDGSGGCFEGMERKNESALSQCTHVVVLRGIAISQHQLKLLARMTVQRTRDQRHDIRQVHSTIHVSVSNTRIISIWNPMRTRPLGGSELGERPSCLKRR